MTDFEKLEELFQKREEWAEAKPVNGSEESAFKWTAMLMRDLQNNNDADDLLEETIERTEREIEAYRS